MYKQQRISNYLAKAPSWIFILYATLAAFVTYSCVYAFRKAFTVATFDDMTFWGVNYKIWLIIAQILGYTASKFIGIKVISEMQNKQRFLSICVLTGIAWISLLFVALVPAPWNIVFMFINGVPLGLLWGVVFSYLEGRRTTEMLGAGLCISFIISTGIVKAVSKFLLMQGVSEMWMPFLCGLIFVIPLLIASWLLDRVPPPDEKDVELRTERAPMNKKERIKFFLAFGAGLTGLVICYVLLMVVREFRDDFRAEIWNELGYANDAAIFVSTEIPIAIGVLALMASIMFIKNNMRAFILNHVFVLVGFACVGISTFLFSHRYLSAELWMVLNGLGIYLAYIPFNAFFFDRLIAAFKYTATVGFLIYLCDSFGYLGSIGVLLYKQFGALGVKSSTFFIELCYIVSIAGSAVICFSLIYFFMKYYKIQITPRVLEVNEPKLNHKLI